MLKIKTILVIGILQIFQNTEAQTTSLASISSMSTRWDSKSKELNNKHPNPQLQRNNWLNLNGNWQISIVDSIKSPSFGEDSILVPFPVESVLSGVNRFVNPNESIWYRKIIMLNDNDLKNKTIIHFGAVDYYVKILINGREVGDHTGGYQSFSYDISKYLKSGENEIIAKVNDPSDRGINPHGKQTLNPENIYYTPSSGIWQTVWLEQVGDTYVSSLKSTPDIDKELINVIVNLEGVDTKANYSAEIIVKSEGKEISKQILKIPSISRTITSTIQLKNPHLWSPNDPFLYDLTVKVLKNSKPIDEVNSYFGMRKIDIQKDEKGMDRIFLNNKYVYNLGTLDQGFWPDGLYTAPSDEALEYDIKAIKMMGFNMIRKHIKIEPERWYYYTDKLGILVWQDFVNPPHGLPEGSRNAFEKEVKETIDQLYNHPSIITWVLFNEGWGAYNQTRLTNWVKKYDSTRLINGHSGQMLYTNDQLRAMPVNPWIGSDMVDVHSYPFPRNTLNLPGKAKVIGEFGGIGVSVNDHEWNDMQGWGYIQLTAKEMKEEYSKMVDSLKKLEALGLSASIYTQPFDVEGEENGIITYDREVIKIPIDTLRKINSLLVSPTKAFNDNNFFLAKNIDINDNDSRFEELLKEYKKGSKDSALLRRLTLIAYRQKDQDLVTKIGNDFIAEMKSPYNISNLKFIQYITRTPEDKGFDMFLNHSEQIDKILGKNTSSYTVKGILRKYALPSTDSKNKNIDWEKLQQDLTSKYGQMGEEAVLGRRMLEYGIYNNPPNWQKFGEYYMLYFKKALDHSDFDINKASWMVFEHVTDPKVLLFAKDVVKYAIDNYDRSPEILDTYANLLHKTQQTQTAIEWEEKALQLMKGRREEKEFAETLQKMKDNKPTWPQN